MYIHVPFCATRCGYCDFNTYTPGELGTASSPAAYIEALEVELRLAARQVDTPVDTIFVGGGTPSLLGADRLVQILDTLRRYFDLAEDCEITTESNPESTSPEFFQTLRTGGFTRISLGMQSVSERVLQVLDRTHTAGRAVAAAAEARAAGFKHVNLDLMYGTPGETDEDVMDSVQTAINAGVDHVSAYSLIVESATKMGRLVRTGQLPAPDDDVMARRYELISDALEEAGFHWYEVSNWAREGGECRHNVGYWRLGEWWGAGPGAHSNLATRRFFNVKHPRTYYQRLAAGELPIAETEILNEHDRHVEEVMLGLRTAEGIPRTALDNAADEVLSSYVQRGWVDVDTQRIAVTRAGRLMADTIITDLLLAEESH